MVGQQVGLYAPEMDELLVLVLGQGSGGSSTQEADSDPVKH